MPQKTHRSSRTPSASSNAGAAAEPKRRAKRRKPPVAERMTVSGPVQTPSSRATAKGAPVPGPLVSAPPAVTAPPVPSGFLPADPADLLGFRALPAQTAAVDEAITELGGSTSYRATFGVAAPDVTELTRRLRIASQWTFQLTRAAAWLEYVKSQQGVAWKDALLLLDGLKKPFAVACVAEPAVLVRYSATASLLQAKSVVAKRSAAERARRKAAARGAGSDGGA